MKPSPLQSLKLSKILHPLQVLEQYDDLYALPRAVHFDDETMRVFQACGLADEVVKTTKLNKGMRFVDKVGFRKFSPKNGSLNLSQLQRTDA